MAIFVVCVAGHFISTPHTNCSNNDQANVLVSQEKKGLLADFGLADIAEVQEDGSVTRIVEGNGRYLAPELLDPGVVGKKNVNPSPESDMHSFGMLMLEVVIKVTRFVAQPKRYSGKP